jgi:hypothetical protein
MGERRNAYRILVVEREGIRPFWRYRHDGRMIFKRILKTVVWSGFILVL